MTTNTENVCVPTAKVQVAWLILLLLVLFGVDWTARFAVFRWHDGLVRRASAPLSTRGPEAPMQRIEIPAVRGGDLTRLVGFPSFAERFAEEKPATVIVTDEHGYRNDPPTEGITFPVVVTGDSFFHVQYGPDGSFPKQLASVLDMPLYNHAYPGRGMFWGMIRFLSDPRFADRRPKVVVWGCLERDISGQAFAGFVHQVWQLEQPEMAAQERVARGQVGVAWNRLVPASLRSSLPDSSWLGAYATRFWNRARFAVFGQVTEDVVVSLPDAKGGQELFYRIALQAMAWPRDIREPEKVGWGAAYIRRYLQSLGMDLVVVLIPDKESVFRERIPSGPGRDPSAWPPSTLLDVEDALRAEGVTVVNLLPAFREQAERGVPLYWRDDTHWRPEAMALAAELTAPVVRARMVAP